MSALARRRRARPAAASAAWLAAQCAALPRLVAGAPAAQRHAAADAAQRLHPADAGRLHVRADAAGAAGRLDQLPAQPRLPADLPAGRQRRRRHARQPRHAARPHAAPAPRRRRCSPASRRCSSRARPAPARRATASACASIVRRRRDARLDRRARRTAGARRTSASCRRARGLHAVPPLRAETRFPLGLFRAWTVWRPAAQVLVYPRPRRPPPPLPRGARRARRARPRARSAERRRVRRRARLPARRSAQARACGRRPPRRRTRRTGQPRHQRGAAPGALARLRRPAPRPASRRGCRGWPPGCSPPTRAGVDYGLRLPGREIAAGARRSAQRARCLEALALWQLTRAPVPRDMPRWPAGAPAARRARHAVPARRHRLDRCCRMWRTCRVWCIAARRRWCCSGAAGWRVHARAAAGPLVVVALLAVALAGDLVDAPHAARQGSRRHADGGAAGAQDAGAARAARRLRGLLPGLLHVLTNFLYSQSLPSPAAMLVAVLGPAHRAGLAHMPVGQPRLAQAGAHCRRAWRCSARR